MTGRAAPQERSGPQEQSGRPGSLLGIYLNDHLAGATGGAGLSHRLADAYADRADGDTLGRIANEIAQDRTQLLKIMARLDVPVQRHKMYATWATEKFARLKFNGRLRGRSPLSDVIELETLRLAVAGKTEGWRTLRRLQGTDERLKECHLDDLLARARRQAEEIDELRARTISRAFTST